MITDTDNTDAIIHTINSAHPDAPAGELARLYVESTGMDSWFAQTIAHLHVRARSAEAALTVSQNVIGHLQGRLDEHDELIKEQQERLNGFQIRLRRRLPATAPFPRA